MVMDTTTNEISTMLGKDLFCCVSNVVLHIDQFLERTSMPTTISQLMPSNQSNLEA